MLSNKYKVILNDIKTEESTTSSSILFHKCKINNIAKESNPTLQLVQYENKSIVHKDLEDDKLK